MNAVFVSITVLTVLGLDLGGVTADIYTTLVGPGTIMV